MTKFSADKEADIVKAVKYYKGTPGVKKKKKKKKKTPPRLQPSFLYLINLLKRISKAGQHRTQRENGTRC